MKSLSIFIGFLTFFSFLSCKFKSEKPNEQVQEAQASAPEIKFIEHEADQKIDVMVNGKLFTSYRWPDNVYKPILYPVLTSNGTAITRGFPLETRENEQIICTRWVFG